MQIINITNKSQLNKFVGSLPLSQFLQSFEWGEFQEKVAGKIFRIAIEEQDEIIAVATLIKRTLPMGKSYFYCPRGPIINIKDKKLKIKNILEFLFGEIKKLAEKEGVMFLRFEPQSEIKNLKSEITKTLDVQPSKTLILDLAQSEQELLKQMHQKTRYNIKLAEKKGVKIKEADLNQFSKFWQLLQQTGQRDKFRLHPINYYQEMLKIDKNFIKLFLADYQDKIICAGIFSFFGDTACYLHGAAAGDYRQVMAPYLLHWQLIKLAKEQGFGYYDFNGIDEKKWPGVTRFKKGFARFDEANARRGGKEVNYPGTFDLVFDQGWYNIYRMVRKVRRTF